MQADPVQEWRRLTELYREMCDGELYQLAASLDNLTEVARQVLRDETRKRGLDRPPAGPAPRKSDRFALSPWKPSMDSPDGVDEDDETGLPHEYTWKTLLCECDGRQQAWQIYEVLRRSGIESWIEFPHCCELDLSGPRVLVAADQLDEARQIAARPIPQEIVEESKIEIPDFEPPSCPGCGAGDPVLEHADQSNDWRCEVCGTEWTEEVAALSESPGTRWAWDRKDGKSRPATGQLSPQGE